MQKYKEREKAGMRVKEGRRKVVDYECEVCRSRIGIEFWGDEWIPSAVECDNCGGKMLRGNE